MKKLILRSIFFFVLCANSYAQRGNTGDKTFSDRFPEDVIQEYTRTYLRAFNETDHDIIVLVRGQNDEYLRHVYIRSNDFWTIRDLPITRFYVQFKNREFYFEDFGRTVMNFADKHSFYFYYNPQKEHQYKRITEEEFFRS